MAAAVGHTDVGAPAGHWPRAGHQCGIGSLDFRVIQAWMLTPALLFTYHFSYPSLSFFICKVGTIVVAFFISLQEELKEISHVWC